MATFKTFVETSLLKEPNPGSAPATDKKVPKGTKFFSEEQSSNYLKTTIEGATGFIQFLGVSDEVPAFDPPEESDLPAFCDMVTRAAREAKADRDYMMAFASCETDNFSKFGSQDKRFGPFQFDEEAWKEAIADSGPAGRLGFKADDRLRWERQPRVAALIVADLMQRFQKAQNRLPTYVELYFVHLLGPVVGLNVLGKSPTTTCAQAIEDSPPAGSYAKTLKESDKTIEGALGELRTKFIAALAKTLELLDKQPADVRFEDPADGTPPWLRIARQELSVGVSENSDRTNSARIKEYLAKAKTDVGDNTAWCGAFAAFCMMTCDDPKVVASIITPGPAVVNWWETWGEKVTGADGERIGTVIVFEGHMGFLAEGSTDTTIQLLAGNQGGGGHGPDSVSIVPFKASDVLSRHWLPGIEVSTGTTVNATGDDAKFVTDAPGIMKRLRGDFPDMPLYIAAAILGNIGHECAGFRHLHQLGRAEGEGGYGWCQWDDVRREAFLAWAKTRGGWESDQANYSYLVEELRVSENIRLQRTMAAPNLDRAVEIFDREFERSGVPAWPSRKRYARLAQQAYRAKFGPA